MNATIVMKVLARFTAQDVTLDALVLALKDLLVTAGAPGILALLLELIDHELIEQWRAGQLAPPPCCDHPHYKLQDTFTRTLDTSLGSVSFPWRMLRCQTCGHCWIPLRESLALEKYQRHSRELERQAIEKASEQSYRQTAADLERTEQIQVGKSTIHRWVRDSDSDTLPEEPPHFPILELDGLNFHRHPFWAHGNNRGEVRVAIGLTGENDIVGVGAWSGVSWGDIGTRLQTDTGGPRAVALISDGEPGILEGVGPIVKDVQRCLRHLWMDLTQFLYKDGIGKDGQQVWKQYLVLLLAVLVPGDSPEHVETPVLDTFRRAIAMAQAQLTALIAELHAWGAEHAATYLQNAQPYVFTYVKCWVQYYLTIPRTTAAIESVMGRIGQRIKDIAQNWSDEGAGQMARIILKRLDNAQDWEAYWGTERSQTEEVQLTCEVSLA